MNRIWRTLHRRTALWLPAVLAAVGTATVAPVASTADPSLNQLNQQLGTEQARQSSLQASLAGLGQIALVQSREATVRGDLARDRAALAAVGAALGRERQVLAALQARLARSRLILSRQLVSQYESGSPDLVDVVLESRGFRDLLERITFLTDAERQQQRLIVVIRAARAQALQVARRLARLQAADRRLTDATLVRLRALAGMNELLRAKQAALSRAQAAQRAALAVARARAGALQARIAQVEAQQAAAERAAATSPSASAGPTLGPSDGWAIPYAIVLCESGGQNLPPNRAGASGYYQILPSTWKEFGGTGPAAYLASKAEQDAVASRIWAGGAGASNWVCASIVGIH
jgi:peptidoglycan hydrolase CwlO-like protein